MCEEWNCQVSLKFGRTGEGMVNFRGDTPNDVAEQIGEFINGSGQCMDRVLGLLGFDQDVPATTEQAVQNFQNAGMNPQPVYATMPQAQPVPVPHTQMQTMAKPHQMVCQHGQRSQKFGRYKSGAKTGRSYEMWQCPAGRNSDCKTEFIDRADLD
jgi:hypothetical protein